MAGRILQGDYCNPKASKNWRQHQNWFPEAIQIRTQVGFIPDVNWDAFLSSYPAQGG